ncbi:DNA-3-methyladenine glycosylase [Aquibacillus halophilus]|uniref:Putative 3-methyladenine DNA glycosylase n=1 Tax=Aquibacillus halophilus TaxID=930132 RepID=A0A6A8DDY1_9BACI|nr:DNA-3-methyladenine glycosylase [Aquibacillus halophilus]MRH43774.1 DNA-3-methyladenine glycosylase [Aquibacillus halophilus]
MRIDQQKPCDISFFGQPTLELAKALLGCLLIKQTNEGVAAGIIVETEAYRGPEDQAAHSFNNRRTNRTEIMFGNPGFTYTYSMHTHCLFNVVSGEKDNPEAVLIRAIEPYFNKELMETRRPNIKNEKQITNGPGKLTKALGINMNDYGHLLTQKPLWISDSPLSSFSISSGPRIGIENSGEAKHYPWRYWITGNNYLSR